MNILVTGHKGFFASHLLPKLQDLQYVIHIYSADLNDTQQLEAFFQQHRISKVIHLAGAFTGDFDTLIQKNVLTTYNLAKIAAHYHVSQFIFSSTGAVYGNATTPTPETHPLTPVTPYGMAKLFAEQAAAFFARTAELPITVLRFPNIYFGDHGAGVIAQFVKQIKTTGTITLKGSGEQKRDFLHLDDACQAVLLSLTSQTEGIFNISSSDNLSLTQVIEKLRETHAFQVRQVAGDNQLYDLSLDFSKAANLLGYSPKKKFLEL